MRVPIDWLRDYVALSAEVSAVEIAARLTAYDLKLEEIDVIGADIRGPIVVGRVLIVEPEEHSNGKTVNWCRVDVGPEHNADGDSRGIVCGAHNFVAGDLVVVSLPGAVLPGGFAIAARSTYGHTSDGMICSGAELGIAGDPGGIVVLPAAAAEVGDDAIELLGLRAEVLDLEVNPDRAYALSLRGVARDTALAFDVAFRDPADIAVPEAGQDYPVVVEAPDACPVFVARSVIGFDASRPTPAWIGRRVELAGMRPISLAVDITNYVMLELGQPLHGYDRASLRGPIVVRRAGDGETLTTLDDVKRVLTGDDVLIVDDSGPIGLAGVMGGQHTELSATTTDIVIEAAHFDAASIARAARRHKLPSEASKRFERGVDFELPAAAAQRVAELLIEHGGGTIEPGLTVVGHPSARPAITMAADLPARVTGVAIDAATAVRALEANGCVVAADGDSLTATPPSWRPDLTDPYDLVEEVLRHVGYDKVPSVLPDAPAGRGLTTSQRLRRRTGLALAGNGLVEVKTFPFSGPADFDRLGLEADDSRRRQVMLANPLSAEEPGMSTTLLPALLKTVALNVGRGHHDVLIFETGRVFLPREDAGEAPIFGVDSRPTSDQLAALEVALPDQPHRIGIAMAGDRLRAGWWGSGRAVTWSDPIASVREVARVLNVSITVKSAALAPWHPGRCAAVLLDGEVIGYAGELHPRVTKAYGLPPRTVAAEVDLDAMIAAAPELGPTPSFSAYPVAKEDVALVVEDSVTAGRVLDALSGASDLIESVRLFDIYVGDQVPAGHKSIAFALRLRALDHTLTDDEIKTAREAAVAAAHKATGAIQRT